MEKHKVRGDEVRSMAKALVLEFMQASNDCRPTGSGMRQAQIFRECGLDWGEYANATSSNQQYWVVALLRELEVEGKIERTYDSGPWRLT
jgi:hypothetical protein